MMRMVPAAPTAAPTIAPVCVNLDLSRAGPADVAEGAEVLMVTLDGFHFEKYNKIYKSDSVTLYHY